MTVQQLTLETLIQLAESRAVRLPSERAAALLEQVNGLFAFTRELDELVTPGTQPTTSCIADE
jgi:Asp-tRNA(Asn)/Glu-tRNA(Gln) amidotransferase C subunit